MRLSRFVVRYTDVRPGEHVLYSVLEDRYVGIDEPTLRAIEAWAEGAEPRDNFEPLRSLDWQVHVYGNAAPELAALCAARRLALHVFPWRDSRRSAGFAPDAVYLIRPDGYVGCATDASDATTLERYLDAWVIRTRSGV